MIKRRLAKAVHRELIELDVRLGLLADGSFLELSAEDGGDECRAVDCRSGGAGTPVGLVVGEERGTVELNGQCRSVDAEDTQRFGRHPVVQEERLVALGEKSIKDIGIGGINADP
jgi:hypothetical protein